MALFDQYTKPGVYTFENVEDAGITLFGDLRIPTFIGEGQETQPHTNTELHRGSSSVADDLVVKANISDQVTGTTRQYQLPYFPVVKGDGTGTTTNSPTDITVLVGGNPVAVTTLDGATGIFQLHDILTTDMGDVEVTFYFKRKDTYIQDEDLSSQIPSFATWTGDPNLTLTLTLPGELGDQVSLALTSLTPTTDALAISGAGTNNIAIELRKTALTLSSLGNLTISASAATVTRSTGSWLTDGVNAGTGIVLATSSNATPAGTHLIVTTATDTVLTFTGATLVDETVTDATATSVRAYTIRTYGDLQNLLDVGIPTPAGYIALQSPGSLDSISTKAVAAVVPTLYRNGAGPNTNTTFKLKNVPVVDGSNGGVVTTNPTYVTVKVNNVKAAVKALDGDSGLITLATPVLAGQTLTASYYTNTYQDTYDLLPASNIVSIDRVGFGPDRDDFINTVDYVLEQPAGKAARIQWGASSSTTVGKWSAGYTPFDGTVVTTTLVDQRMYLQPCQGTVDGKNATFTLPDVPCDGSGLSRATNDPSLIHVYLGTDPVAALAGGEVRVIQLTGSDKVFKLYNPPSAGLKVFASYYRNELNDHTFTMSVVNPGILGQGTYKIVDELGNTMPVVKLSSMAITEAAETVTGLVWPHSFSDLTGVGGQSPDETITLTFQAGDPAFIVTPATQATLVSSVNAGLRFRSTTTGNQTQSAVSIQFVGVTQTADNVAVDFSANTIKVYTVKSGGGARTLQDIINLFNSLQPTRTATGVIICEPVSGSTVLTTTAVAGSAEFFVSGSDAVTTPRSLHYLVTSSRTAQQALVDNLGRTGGATTPALPNYNGGAGTVGSATVGSTGYLGQTYVDEDTGIQFTLVNPDDALSYGYTTLPSPAYHFRPGDVITITVSASTARPTSVVPTIDLYGLRTKVVSTYGMRIGDTVQVATYNKAGDEPNIGDFYYVSYTTEKTDADLALKLFTNPADAYALYGTPSPTNKLSLAVKLFYENGGQVFACKQVKKDTGLETASDQTFMDAISLMAQPLPGSDRKTDMIQPTTTSPVVLQYLNRHLITQAAPRNSGEAMSCFGFGFTDTPATMRTMARDVKSDRMIGIAAPGVILELDVDGKSAEFAVGGEFLAAAMAGMMIDPSIDVATTLTRKKMVGFSRLIKRYDDPTMDLMAADGLTVLVELDGAFQIRHWVTTDMSSPLKREPTSRLVIDYTRKVMRRNLDQFIGRKLIQSAVNSVTVTATATLKSLIEQEIIEGFKNLTVMRDDNDPTVLHVAFYVKPIFSLLWIPVELTVTMKL